MTRSWWNGYGTLTRRMSSTRQGLDRRRDGGRSLVALVVGTTRRDDGIRRCRHPVARRMVGLRVVVVLHHSGDLSQSQRKGGQPRPRDFGLNGKQGLVLPRNQDAAFPLVVVVVVWGDAVQFQLIGSHKKAHHGNARLRQVCLHHILLIVVSGGCHDMGWWWLLQAFHQCGCTPGIQGLGGTLLLLKGGQAIPMGLLNRRKPHGRPPHTGRRGWLVWVLVLVLDHETATVPSNLILGKDTSTNSRGGGGGRRGLDGISVVLRVVMGGLAGIGCRHRDGRRKLQREYRAANGRRRRMGADTMTLWWMVQCRVMVATSRCIRHWNGNPGRNHSLDAGVCLVTTREPQGEKSLLECPCVWRFSHTNNNSPYRGVLLVATTTGEDPWMFFFFFQIRMGNPLDTTNHRDTTVLVVAVLWLWWLCFVFFLSLCWFCLGGLVGD